jgi:signal transduction histidine kinase/AmiR/NasT family two-component response regulator
MNKTSKLQAYDLKLLVSHSLSIEASVAIDEVVALSRKSSARYFAVLEAGRPVGIIPRDDGPDEPQQAKPTARCFGWMQRAPAEVVQVRDMMIPDPLVVEYGTSPEVLIGAVFRRDDSCVNQDVILTRVDGSFLGVITVLAVMRLLYGFLGRHMKDLRVQKEAISLENSQLVQIRRDLELTNEKLARSRDQALEGVRQKSQFLANMSHEIRTPMNGVFGMIDLLHDTNLDENQEKLVSIAHSSAETLLRIIDDILEFSKIEAGKVSIEHMPFNLTETVESSVALYSEAAAAKGLDLAVSFEDAPAWVVGDPHRYQQVLNNLISNALKFTDAGEVKVTVRKVDAERGPSILTEVKDCGIGISAAQRDELFAPFCQADASYARKFGGTGLGLSICKNLVDLLGGELHCESEIGNGSIFSMLLPFKPYAPDSTGQVTDAAATRVWRHDPVTELHNDFSGMRVLLVEDNRVNQEVARRFLLKLNCEVHCAANGQLALESLNDARFDCVLMDCQMPVLDGYEATRQIRQGKVHATSCNVFIAAMTAHAMSWDRRKCIETGMDHYISKPVGLHSFRQALELASQKTAATSEHNQRAS